jgi:HSP20 family molecular chaperone IbpA
MPRMAEERKDSNRCAAKNVGYREVPRGTTGTRTSYPESGEQPLVTMWVGVQAIVVAISVPGVKPDNLQVSVLGSCLKLRGIARDSLFSQDISLPWPVEPNPVRVDDGSGLFHVLLQRKKTRAFPARIDPDSAILKSVRLYFATDGRRGARRGHGTSRILKSLEGYLGRERQAKGDLADPG